MKKLVTALCCSLSIFCAQHGRAQSLAINTDGSSANASALLDVKSNTKGMLVPRMTRTERNAIVSPATGLLIFQTGPDSVGFHYFDGSRWTLVHSNANADTMAWKTGGNTGTTAGTHFLGTTDNVPLVIKTNNTERLRVTTNNEVGIGTATPNSTYGYAKLELASEGFLAPTDILIRNAANNAGYGPGLVFQHARGTLAAPLAVNSGDYLAAPFVSMGYSGTGYQMSAAIDVYAEGTITSAKVPARVQFATTNDAGSYAYRMTLKNNGNLGVGTASPAARLHVAGGNFVADGTLGTDTTLGFSGGGTRMFFYPRKAAFRAGYTTGTQSDDANIGNFSIAMGVNAVAKTDYSISIGEANVVETNVFGVAIGRQNHTTGWAALSMGHFSEATGDYSASIGLRDTVSGFGAAAMGSFNKVAGVYTFSAGVSNNVTGGVAGIALGNTNTVSGDNAFVAGFGNTASSNSGIALGNSNTVSGVGGFASGLSNAAPSFAETTTGLYATQYVPLSAVAYNAADRVFTVGNGSSSGSRSDALVILKSGNTGVGTNSPKSTLEVNGTMAMGVSNNIAGGPGASPVSLATAKSYIGLLPADGTNNNYQLPDPTTCTGRMYIIRNNSSSFSAVLSTAAGLLFPGNSATGGSSYGLNPTSTVKTVMCVSDGANWTVMQMN